MANPQKENGHIDIANEIAEALMRTNLSAYQWRILWALWRKTYGWHKKEDWISNSQFVEMTGIAKGHVSRSVKELTLRNIVTNSGNTISFNKDYTQWRELPHGVRAYQTVTNSGNSVTNPGNSVTPSGNEVTPSGVHKRNFPKETSQKKSLQKKNGNLNIPFQEIILYLNQKAGTNFSHINKHTTKLIHARWNEGHRLDHFKTVIDKKCAQWLTDVKMTYCLRPKTLFSGVNFESYLSERSHPDQGKINQTGTKSALENWSASH